MSEVSFEGYLAEQGLDNPGAIDEPQVEPQQEVVETPVAEEPAQVVDTPQEQSLLAGKYKSAQDLEAAYKNLEREKGRLAQELGEWRQQAQQTPQTPVNPDVVEEAFATNPVGARNAAQQAAQQALDQGDHLAYEQIVETWGQYDQFGALRFDAARQAAEAQKTLMAQWQPQVATANQYAEQQANLQAEIAVKNRHADFETVVGDLADETRVRQIVDAGFPVALLQGANGSQADKEALLETLYRWVKSEQAETAQVVSAEIAAETQAANKQAKQQSAVASASSTPVIETPSEDKELEAFYDFLKAPSPTSWADLRPTGQ